MLPIGKITDYEYLEQMAKTETDKYIFTLRIGASSDFNKSSNGFKTQEWESNDVIRAKISETLDSRFKVVSVKKESWTYPPSFKRPYVYYQNIKPMTLLELMKSAVEADLIKQEHFGYINEIVCKEDD